MSNNNLVKRDDAKTISIMEDSPVYLLSVYELIRVLINRGLQSNGFEFVSKEQMNALIAAYNRENPDNLIN